jgi:flagellar biosynthetic protein FlhB
MKIQDWGRLQRFAAEDEGRTEEPTGKRISKARSEGNVAKSIEIPQVAVLLLSFLLLARIHVWMIQRTMDHFERFLGGLDAIRITEEAIPSLVTDLVVQLLLLTSPFLILAAVVVFLSYYFQFGFLFSWQALQPRWENLFHPQRVLDMFLGKTMLFNLAKSAGKVILLSAIAGGILWDERETLYFLFDHPAPKAAEIIFQIASDIVWSLSILLACFAAADYAYNRYRWKDALKMTKFEVKDEQKQSEGDPLIKAAQRKRMMEIFRRRMLKKVPEADVVITNPTHYAVALKYEMETMEAPEVIAKGEGLLARRIREIAEQHGVPVLRRPELARSIYFSAEVGDPIPPDLFAAVAEVLAYVYKMRGRRVRREPAPTGV